MRFEGEFDFLSNFFPAEVRFGGMVFPTVEHAYQAAKTLDLAERETVRMKPTPGQAKRAGRLVTIRPDWEDVKIGVMRDCLTQKFSEPELMHRLLAISGEIVEENNWGDTFWGVCEGEGKNLLGKLLTGLRETLRLCDREH